MEKYLERDSVDLSEGNLDCTKVKQIVRDKIVLNEVPCYKMEHWKKVKRLLHVDSSELSYLCKECWNSFIFGITVPSAQSWEIFY